MKLKNTVALFLSLLLMTNAFITANAAVGESVGADPTYAELYCSKTAKEAIDGDVLEQVCDLLVNRLEPQAVNLLLDKMPAIKAAAEQGGLSSEIGMYVYYGRGDYDCYAHFIDGTAAASTSICPIEDDDDNNTLGQIIAFNAKSIVKKDEGGNSYIDTDSHEWLRFEYAVLHELVHAMMNDYNRAGMMGYNDPDSINIGYNDIRKIRNEYIKLLSFPEWFVEGTASVIGDGYDQVDDIYETFKNTDGVFTAESVLNAYLDNQYHTLKSGSLMAGYVSGYLAIFYLSDLAAKQNPEVGAAQDQRKRLRVQGRGFQGRKGPRRLRGNFRRRRRLQEGAYSRAYARDAGGGRPPGVRARRVSARRDRVPQAEKGVEAEVRQEKEAQAPGVSRRGRFLV